LGACTFFYSYVPYFFWLAAPAPNDILRVTSSTPIADNLAQIFQIILLVALVFCINTTSLKPMPLIGKVLTLACCVVYYIGWFLYYLSVMNTGVVLILTLVPCIAFILFAAKRKNFPAIFSASCFMLCHLFYAFVNFIL
jgi:hypothetical protein